jgi:hypothetical protein
MAAMSEIDERNRRNIDHDLAAWGAIEGLMDEQRQKVRLRAAWLAERFIRNRRDDGALICDDCGFDPCSRIAGTAIKPRTLLMKFGAGVNESGHRKGDEYLPETRFRECRTWTYDPLI